MYNRNPAILGTGNKDSDIMLIAEYPNMHAVRTGELFAGSEYAAINKMFAGDYYSFDNVVIKKEDLFITYAVKWNLYNSDTEKINLDHYNTCFEDTKHLLLDEITTVKPKVIITMGKRITELFLGKKNINIHDYIGRVYGHNLEGIDSNIKIIPAFGAYSIQKLINGDVDKNNTSRLTNFFHCLDIGFQYASGDQTVGNNKLTETVIIKSVDEFNTLLGYCEQTGICCFDYETTGLKWYDKEEQATILSISFQVGSSYIIPLYHKEPIFELDDTGEKIIKKGKYLVTDFKDTIFDEDTISYFFTELERRIFNNSNIIKIAHNLMFDLHWNKKYNINKFSGRFNDTMLMAHILNELTPNGLKELTKVYFSHFSNYEQSLKKYDWHATPLEILSPYAGIDTDITLRLWIIFEELLIKDDPQHLLYILYRNLVMPALFSLLNAEHRGAHVDSNLIEESILYAEKVLENKITKLRSFPQVKKFEDYQIKQEIKKLIKLNQDKLDARNLKNPDKDDRFKEKYRLTIRRLKTGAKTIDYELNLNSPKQLGELLFTPQGFNFPKKVEFKNGQVSEVITTDAKYLSELSHPFIDDLFIYRSISKMVSTYYKGILDRLDSNNYLHTSFLLHGTVSGRLSSRNPNLQNIPSRSKLNDEDAVKCLKLVKKFFIPGGEDRYLLQVDYAQAELRIIANFANDPVMIQTYLDGIDIHTKTAASLSGRTVEDFALMEEDERKQQRWNAKGANFGLVYGIGIDGYMQYCKDTFNLILDRSQAEYHQEVFFSTYSTLKDWHYKYESYAKEHGFVRTLFGRKRRLPFINETGSKYQAADIRYAINSPIQGTGGEYTLFASALLRHRLPEDVIFFNTVHDSLFFDLPKDKLERTLEIVINTCENPPIEKYFYIDPQVVPMKVDCELSDTSWGDMKEL